MKQADPKTVNPGVLVETEEYIARIQSCSDKMSDTEKKIAEYYLDAKNRDVNLTIHELSKKTGTSVAAIVRFCQLLGFKGFAEFKYYMQNSIQAAYNGSNKINTDDNVPVIKQKIGEIARNTITNSMEVLNNNELEKAIEAISKAKNILIFGEGMAYGIAHSTANLFMNMGIPCYTSNDVVMILRMASFLTSEDVMIGLSNCGQMKDVVDVMAVAKKKGATTISVTSMTDSLITKYSDIILESTKRNRVSYLEISTVIMSQTVTMYALIIGVAVRNLGRFDEKSLEMKDLSELKRYATNLKQISFDRVHF